MMKAKFRQGEPPREPAPACVPSSPLGEPCPVVALGASAGGLESFRKFFSRMPPDSGLAFILVQHWASRQEAMAPEILARTTKMPVTRLNTSERFEPNKVYFVDSRPGPRATRSALSAVDGERKPPEPMPIDQCFRSLAEDHQEAVIGIVLSGTGTDGTLGLKAIKAEGGLTMAEAPESARYDSLPRNAISSGLVDFVLPAEELPERVIECARHLQLLLRKQAADGASRLTPAVLKRILPLLRRRTGHDFSGYKATTLIRRIQRRMHLLYLDSTADYLKRLRESPAEVELLFKDLLIGVTRFFREPPAFETLAKKAIPAMFEGKRAQATVRVWVPGCATGEEAYSIAILLAEYQARLEAPPKVRVFATDLDTEALEIARKAQYPAAIADHVSPKRLARFFRRRGSGWELVEHIREMCVFSPHNLVRDPPFSRLDLISCRNLLIYLATDQQRRLLPMLHYALNPSGFLLLGPSENLASRSELFRPVDKPHRLFQRRPGILHAASQVLWPEPKRSTRLQTPFPPQLSPGHEPGQVRTLERIILEEYAPACVIVSADGEVLYFSGHTGRFLEPQAGAPSNKLIHLARKHLRVELRLALYRARLTRHEVWRENLTLTHGRGVLHFHLLVRPLSELGQDSDLFIVVFQEVPPPSNGSVATRKTPDAHHSLVQQLEHELRTMREDLRNTIEELESSNEDLKSANEELLSINEELHSANEQLQTSKEELQSANEELLRKNDALDTANADLVNFFQAAQVATVFVDKQLRIKRFTPALARLLAVGETDLGRPLFAAAPDLEAHGLDPAQIHQVLETQTAAELPLPLHGGRFWFLVRITPYRAVDRVVQGAVVTFLDVTELKRSERGLRQLAAIVEGSGDAIISKDLNGTITSWNEAATRLFGYTAAEAVGQSVLLIIPPDRHREEQLILHRIRRGEALEHCETVRRRKDGSLVDISLTVSPVKDARGQVIGASKIARDITDRKRLEESLAQAREKLAQSNLHLETQVKSRAAELVEANSQLEELVYSIAHDLRAPLRSMQAFSTFLLEDCAPRLDDAGRHYASRIQHSAEAMDQLVLDLLAYGRAARAALELGQTAVAAAWTAAVAQNQETIQKSRATVEVVEPLPQVRAHETTLTQVLANLLANALKFVAPGVAPVVRLRPELWPGVVRLWVEDNGIGIAPKHQERVFRIFERLNPSAYPGTGIGLAIVRKGVERMGGRVGLESAPGSGSRFWVELPSA